MNGARRSGARRDWRAETRRWVERYETRPVRERALIAAAICAVAFMLADAVWLAPGLKRYHTARAAVTAAQTGLDQLQQERQRTQAGGLALEAQSKQEIAQWRERVREADAALREQAAGLVGPDQMRNLLGELLAKHGQVRVRSMQSLGKSELSGDLAGGPAAATTPPAAQAAAASRAATAAAATGAARGPALYRHGLELTLEGRYADLAAYVQSLEALPQRLQFGGLQFKVEQHPKAVLTLRLYTLSLERHWLEI